MAFPDLAKKHSTFIAAHGPTETIEYRPMGHALWDSVSAKVTRNPLSPLGEALTNTIDVFVSRAAVLEPNVLGDTVRLPGEEGKPQYVVTEILGEWSTSQGHWLLRCTK